MINKYYGKVPVINILLILVNVIYFIWIELHGRSTDIEVMIDKGAMYLPLVLEQGQHYRLVTCMFMHFGIEHLMNNMLILYILGDNLERALGRIKYLIFYMICGVGANIASMAVNIATGNYYRSVSAGASGAIFGVIGGLLYAVIVNKGRLEDLSTRQLVMLTGFSLYFGFTSTGVDNTAHVAGLILGMILAAILYRKKKPKDMDCKYFQY